MKPVFILFLLLLVSFAYAETSSSTINWLSIGHGDQRYCQQGGNCNVSNLNAINITTQNINGSFSLNGTDIYDLFVPYNNSKHNVNLSGKNFTSLGLGKFGNLAIRSDTGYIDLGATADDYKIQWDSNNAVHTITTGEFVFAGGNVEIDQILSANQLEMQIGNMLFIEQAAPYMGIGGPGDGIHFVEIFGSTYIQDALTLNSDIYDSFGFLTITPTTRQLIASDGSAMLDWSTDGTLDAGDNDFTTSGSIQTTNGLRLYDAIEDKTLTIIHDRALPLVPTSNSTITIASDNDNHNIYLQNWEDRLIGIDQDLRHNSVTTVSFNTLEVTGTAGIKVNKLQVGAIARTPTAGNWLIDSTTPTAVTAPFGEDGGDGKGHYFVCQDGQASIFAGTSGDGGNIVLTAGTKGVGLSGASDGVDGKILMTGATILTGDLDVSGNITGNQIYAEMWNKSPSTTPYVFPIASTGIYYNLTGLVSGMNNGFTFTDTTQALGGSYLTAQVSGRYKASMSISSLITVPSGEIYGYAISHEFSRENHNNCYARRSASNSLGNTGVECFIDIPAGTRVNIQIEQETGGTARDMSISTVNLNLVRIGNIPT